MVGERKNLFATFGFPLCGALRNFHGVTLVFRSVCLNVVRITSDGMC